MRLGVLRYAKCSLPAIFLFLAFVLVWAFPADATTVRFGPNTGDDGSVLIEDALMWQRSGEVNWNYGAKITNPVGERGTVNRERRSLIRFKDIASAIPSGQSIVSAKFFLYLQSEDSTTDYSISAYRVLLDWVEGTADGAIQTGSSCWNYAKYTALSWNTAGCGAASDVTGEDSTADRRATAEDSTNITADDQWYSWDLTNAVSNWYNGTWSEYGVVLICDSPLVASTRKVFRSTENGNDGFRPYLEVVYEAESNAVTEFVCTIKNSGGDYSTLWNFESKVQCDLTALSTKVFDWDAKGISGVPGDGAAVRKSTDPNTTATCVHVTGTNSGQILLKNISGGTFGDNDVVQAVSNPNISVTLADRGQMAIAVAECYDPLTENPTFAGWTTNETNYVKITTDDDSQLNLSGNFIVQGEDMYVVLATDMQANIVTVNYDATLKILGDKSLTATNSINVGWPSQSNDTGRIIAAGDPAMIKEDHSLPPAWYNAGWKYSQKLSIDHTKIDVALTDFPVLVRLTADVSDVFGEAQSDGDDILFTTADGVTRVDHELEKYADAAGSEELIAHVEIPSVAADQDTVFYMYYGNSSVSSQQSPAGTWNTNFQGVWHLSEDPMGTVFDSTSNDNDGSPVGGMTSDDQVSGKIDGSLDFDGTDDYVDVPSLAWQPTEFSVEFWINPATHISYNQAVLATNGWDAFIFHTTVDGALYVGTAVANRFAPSDLPANTLVLNEWQHFVYTLSGGVARFYKDGQLLASKGQSAPIAWGGFRMGSPSGTSTLHGRLDEVRISDVARSDAWVKATYYSQANALLVSPGTDNGVTLNAINVYINGVSGVGASVTATGQGFLPDQGPGAGEMGTSDYGAGGGYGGQGGDSDDGGQGGATYGSIANPDDLGSGGGTIGAGRGGASITINATNFVSVNGSLLSSGDPAQSGTDGGGGAGGAIKVTCGTLAGLGQIHANGGAGVGHGGGGGGGRIYLRYGNETFTGTISVAGGTKGGDNTLSSQDGDGADGTLYETDTVAETVYWDNENNTGLWSDAINWSSDEIPGPGDTVIFDGDYSTDDCIADGVEDNLDSIILEDDYGGQVTFNADFVNGGGELTLTGTEGLKVLSGTVLCEGDVSAIGSGTAQEPHGAGITISAVNITVASGAEINANDQGFPDQQGPGAETPHAGAGHGGLGGNPWDSTLRGSTYGSLSEPTSIGSGGGSSDGGTGGGAIRLVVANTLTVNGTISANGGNATATNHGGGSGGSMWISTDTFVGSGFVMADGGGGNNAGGGGGGGRMSLQWTSGAGKRTFNGVISAKGGARGLYGGTQEDGKHGTVYVPSGLWNELWNATYPVNGDAALVPGTYNIAHLHITNGATLECQGDPDDGTDGSGVIINATDIIVDSGSGISADGLGFLTYDGPGIADNYAGASHGGRGGNSWSTSSSAVTYGSLSGPVSLGSGGGSVDGGTGGGAVKLVVANTITVDGTISANGGRGIVGNGGGGAGGSIWIVADAFAGMGSITADGGGSYNAGGGGGGGRISLQWTAGASKRTYDGAISAQGGAGGWYGGNQEAGKHGTIYVPASLWNELWNVMYPVNGDIALAPGMYDIAYLHVTNDATLECQGDPDDGTDGSGVIINATTIIVDSGSVISADGLGFWNDDGPGIGDTYAGAGHGGRGGNGWASYLCGSTYGSLSAPLALGSGGRSATGGKGGGAVKLNVTGTLTVDGTVSADAGDPAAQGTINTGGSSGGSVWIVTDSLAGSGSITAHGGMGINGGGGGGGGRISLVWTAGAVKRTFSGVISAQRGARGGHSGTQEAGYPGTIYVPPNLWNELWNATYPVNGDIALAYGTYNIQALHVTNNATLSCQGDYDGTPIEGSGVVIVSDDITIDSGAKISVEGEGFGGNAGPGTATNAGDCSGGGGYGGAGGDGRDSTGGPTYGLADQPTSLGSGGGGVYSGKGAGAVKLDVTNTLTIDGMITANGVSGGDYYSGGSGGSIWVICNTLGGSGSLTAHGGNGYGTCAGGGGGGRIRINEQTYSYTGTATVFGGTGLNNGADGTIYYSASGDADGDGMPDAWELRYGLNPSVNDSLSDKDNDGLNNLGEYTRGADPKNPDMDDDGLLDGGEVSAGTDLFDPDTDRDDLSDGWEVDHGFNPLDPNDPGTGVRVWDNDNANNLWSDPVNWSNNTVPVSGDMVVFNATSTANCTGDVIPDNLLYVLLDFGYGGSLTVQQGSIASGSTWSVTGDITVNEGSIVFEGDTTAIGSGTAGTPHGIGITVSAPDIMIRPLGAIHADGEGFGADAGPGNPGYSNTRSAGGSYGGKGNFGARYRAADTYGPVDQPTALGSGGGGVNAGHGGGAIRLNVTNTLTLDGRVSANGTKGSNDYAGGSGGSVWLVCGTLAGDGVISADGANYGGGSGGGGGGGRIALQWGSGNRTFTGTISAAGGYGYRAEYGWPGTIYVPTGLWNELWNGTYSVNGDIALGPGTYNITTLRVTNNAILSCQGDEQNDLIVDNPDGTFTGTWGTSSWAPGYYGTDYHYHDPGAGTDTFTWTLPITVPGSYEVFARWTEDPTRAPDATYTVYHNGGSTPVAVDQRSSGGAWNSLGTYSFDGVDDYVELVQNAGGIVIADAIMVGALPLGQGVKINADSVTIDEGAKISADGDGFSADTGPGNPGYSNTRSAGGSYGGLGTFGTRYRPAETYGSLEQPSALGSGGGGVHAGSGGGAIRLVVTNTLTVSGSISANGTRGLNDYAAGSGGSVWLQCGALAGNGAISADGSNYAGGSGGAGGGGRISLQWGSGNRTFSGTISAAGGYGYRGDYGRPGTIYVPSDLWNELYNGTYAVNGSVALASGTYNITTLHVTNNATLSCKSRDAGIVIDNPDAEFVGTWTSGTGNNDSYGHNMQYHAAGDGNSTATWTPNIPGADDYSVYAWWAASSNRATNAKYTVQYDGGSETVQVNQEYNGGRWNLLGTFPFAAGTSGYVQLSDDANEYVIADAIMIVKPPIGDEGNPAHGVGVTINSDNVTIDEGAKISSDREGFGSDNGPGHPGYSNYRSAGGSYGGMGSFGTLYHSADTYGSLDKPTALGSGGGGFHAGHGGGAVRLTATNTLTIDGSISANGGQGLNDYAGGSGGSLWLQCATLAGEGTISADGSTYGGGSAGGGGGGRLSLQWGTGNRTFSGTISAAGGIGYRSDYGRPGTIYVPSGLWNELYNGTYPVNGSVALTPGTYNITTLHVTNNATLSCQGGDPGIVIDNVNATFVNTWPSASGGSKYGSDYQYHAAGDGNSTATWIPDIPDADDYSVYAWWAASSNRATNAKYTVSYDGNSETVEVNQRIDGGKWNLLGTFPFAAGTSGYVQLSDDANGYVIADAIMVVKPPQAGEGDPAQGLGVIINSDSVTIDEGAEISAEREGFGSDHGPGHPGYSNYRSAGGSYGGMGGAGTLSGAAPTYGTIYEPLALGSGGGGFNAASGGAAIKLAVTNSLTINGSISANGGQGLSDYAGGSGGSVWLSCGTLAGEGAVSADGGSYGGGSAGGGGGGRIHITRSAWTYTGTVTVSGGVGYNNGEDGTIYYDNPFLEWTGEANYTDDGLDPEWGKATVTTFTYRISYRHLYDKAPTTGYPKIHILKDDVEISGSPFTMSEVDGGDTTYIDGKLYTFPKIIDTKGNYTYHFSTLSPNCGPGMGEGTVQQDAPSVAPLLVAKNQRTSVWYQEIQLALDAALSGDTIEVDSGVIYYEPSTINIPSGVTLTGDMDYPTYTAIKTVDVSPVVSFAAASSGSALKGLTITSTMENLTRDPTARNYFVEIGDGSSGITIEKCVVGRNDYVSGWSTTDSRFLATTTYNEGGIRIGTGSSNIMITNCKVRYLTGPGIAIEDGTNDDIEISNNYIYRNVLPNDLRIDPIVEAPGIGLAGTARASITGNLIYENNVGIGSHDLSGTDGTEGTLYIGTNTIRHNNQAGIGLNKGSTTYFKSAEIIGNDIYSNGTGRYMGGIRLSHAYDVKIKQNHIHDNLRMGAYLDHVYDFEIYNNRIYRNYWSVRLEYMGTNETDQSFFHKNIIDAAGNLRGMWMSQSGNMIMSSNIVENAGRYGIRFNQQYNPIDFSHNRVSNNGRPGIRVDSTFSGNLYKNLIVDNTWVGLVFQATTSGDLHIYNNTVADNGYSPNSRSAGMEFRGGLTTSTYELYNNIFAFNVRAGYQYGQAAWNPNDGWGWVNKHHNFFFYNYPSLSGVPGRRGPRNFLYAQCGGPGGVGIDDVMMAEAHMAYDADAWDFNQSDPDNPYSLDPLDDTGLLTLADGSPGGAYSDYVGRYASYTTPVPPELTSPGDPYVEPPATAPPEISVIVDNPEATVVGDWTCADTDSAAYNSHHCYVLGGDEDDMVTWTPNLPETRNYNVYAWWKAYSNRATNAEYTINYDGGLEVVEVNQEINGSRWNLLGTYSFAAGTSGSVELSGDANEYVIADAIKFEPALSW